MSKVMVSLPDNLLQQIDDEARKRSTSRSALITAAARRELARDDPEVRADRDANRRGDVDPHVIDLTSAAIADWGPADDWADWADATK
ncbi:MAG: CopG family ribbon-helix-helix protein [Acidimicrobiales bacterium]